MSRIIFRIIIISIAAAGGMRCSSTPSCCVISPPRMSLTGDKTVIERQIIGEYKELEKDAWAISSAKTTIAGTDTGSTVSAADPEIFKAMKIREYNSEKITEYKSSGIIGEALTGYIQIINTEKFKDDPDSGSAAARMVLEENSARKTIFTRTLLNMNKKEPSADQIDAFGKLFAEEKRAAARKGDWFQENSGRWKQK
jgi:uncharacterized protein YdbL (DUF1318 family)